MIADERKAQTYWLRQLWPGEWYNYKQLEEITGLKPDYLRRCVWAAVRYGILRRKIDGQLAYFKLSDIIVIPPEYKCFVKDNGDIYVKKS